MNRWTPAVLIAAVTLTLIACAGSPPISEQDAVALRNLDEVAGPTSNVDSTSITSTECWLPSEHLINDKTVSDTTWRVLCRAHYVDSSGDRYQDATCIGDFAVDPMIEHCYRWAFYTGMPRFEDYMGVPAE